MDVAKLKVDRTYASVVSREIITAGLVGTTISVEYAPGIWDGLTKTVVFRGSVSKDVITNNTTIEIPPEVLTEPNKRLSVGFCGMDHDNRLVIPTIWADLGLIQPGADPSGDTSTDPGLPVWGQIASRVEEIAEDVEQLKQTGGGGSGGNGDLTGYATEQWVKDQKYLTAVPDGYAKTSEIPKKPEDIGALPNTYTPPNQTAEQVGADPKGTAATAVSLHNSNTAAHNDIRLELKAINDRLTAFFDSDDQTLDELSEIVAYITSNKSLIDSITTSKVSVADIINNLTSNVSNKPLSAAQGVVLKGLIDAVSKSLSNYQPKGEYLTEVPDGYATEKWVEKKLEEHSGGNVDLEGYATEQWVKDQKYLTAVPDGYAKTSEIPKKPEDIGALPNTYTPPNQTAEQVGADPKGTAASAVSQHNTADDSHGDIRLELKAINDRLTAFFDSDDQTLDELSEIVAYITSNKSLIDSITTSKVSVADIVNNLTSNVSNKPLSAAQGVVLKGLIDAVSTSLANYQPKGDYALRSEIPTVPTKVSAFTNDAGYLTAAKDNATQDSATLGAELASASGWTLGAGWSGSFANGFTHASGNAEPLTFYPSGIKAGSLYQVTFKSSVRMTTTNLFVQVGNSTQFNLYGEDSTSLDGNVSIGVLAANTSGLVFTPESSFTGTLSQISLKEITGTYEAVQRYFDTKNAVSFEIHVTPRGLENVFIGQAVGEMNTSGHENVGIGVNALKRNTSGFWNTAIGKDCLKNNTAGSRNLALGYNALMNNEVGQRNVALGTFAMTQMKNGNWNIAIGSDSMNTATGGDKNVAVGFNTLVHNAANDNVAVGADVLSLNTSGSGNVGVGRGVLAKNTSGINNVCMGYNAGSAITTASGNVGIGWAALYKNTTGAQNIAIGYGAGKAITTGKLNIIIGVEPEVTATGNYQLNIGNLLKGSLVSGSAYLLLNGGLRLPNIPTTAPNNATEVWNNNGVLVVGNGGMDNLVQAVISALPVYNGEVE